jgi:hypothetical protein
VDLDPSPNTITVNVTPVNDAPSGTDTTVTALEDSAYAFGTGEFNFTDAVDANSLLAVKITTLPGAGSLTNNGTAITAGQFVSAADLAAGKLRFTPAVNANGSAYASFTFQVQDNGGTASGGVDLDPSPNTITVNVMPVNDAPTVTNHAFEYLYNAKLSVSGPGVLLNAADIDSPTLASSLISGVSHGQLMLRADGSFEYVPAAGFSGVDSFTFVANDGTLDSPIGTVMLSITPQSNVDFLERTFLNLLRRPVDPVGLAAYLSAMVGGLSREGVIQSVLASQERREYSMRVVDELYYRVLEREADPMGRASWVGQMIHGASREVVLAAFLNSPEFALKNPFYSRFVSGLYRAVLGREPDAAGREYWLTYLLHGGSKADAIDAFISSPEYRTNNPGAFLPATE